MKFKTLFIFYIIVLLSLFKCLAQKKELIVYSSDTVFNIFNYKKLHIDSISITNEINAISKRLDLYGYINKSYTVTKNNLITKVNFNLNPKIDFIKISYAPNQLPINLVESFSKKIKETYFVIPTYKTEETLTNILNYYENKGYSFTQVNLVDIHFKNNIIEAKLNINFNKKRIINSFVIEGYSKFPKKKLLKILKITTKTTFTKQTLAKINDDLKKLNFATSIKKPQVLFAKDSTKLYLYLQKKSTSKIDGLIGFSNKDNKSLKVNGFLNLQLINTFNRNEEIKLNWLSNSNTKTLNFTYFTPYIYNSNFNFGGQFEILRKDSSYVNTSSQFKLGYNLSKNIELSSIISFNKSNITTNSSLANIEEFNKQLFGFSFTFNNNQYSHIYNTSNLNLSIRLLKGFNKINNYKNNQSLYSLTFNYLLKLNQRNFIFIKSKNSYLNTNLTIENEQFRIGGFNTIRGFDEQSIPTTKYSTSSIEYHYLTSKTNYFYTITDISFIEKPNKSTFTGLGLGYNLKSNNTLFNIGYAVGKNSTSEWKFQNSKLLIKISYLF